MLVGRCTQAKTGTAPAFRRIRKYYVAVTCIRTISATTSFNTPQLSLSKVCPGTPKINIASRGIASRSSQTLTSFPSRPSCSSSNQPALANSSQPLLRYPSIGMSQRRSHSTNTRSDDKKSTNGHHIDHEHELDHSHSHSIFGHSHSHDDGHNHNTASIVEAFQGKGDRGSHITLVGLFANVVLTATKGAAGWYMHSASLLADAGHCMSDLLGDIVTLFCWKLSRKLPSDIYPYGYAKFETLGTTSVSLLLIGGALGIGFHSYHLLIEAMSHSVSTMSPGMIHDVLQQASSVAQQVPIVGHSHGHVDVLDPNAAWFAAISVLAKEWLYRITKKVADEESSPVLHANAIHHRSDAYSSLVALVAILGSWFFPALPLDPIGGLIVSGVILWQGLGLFRGAFRELTDAGVSEQTHYKLMKTLQPLVSSPSNVSTSNSHVHSTPPLLAIRHLRARHAGSHIYVDLTAEVPEILTVHTTSELEDKITTALKDARKEISEVRVRFHPVRED